MNRHKTEPFQILLRKYAKKRFTDLPRAFDKTLPFFRMAMHAKN